MLSVDGMSGNSDRGGVQELLSIAKISKNPIICICNDRQSPKIRSLANSSYDLKVKRPTKGQIATRMVAVAVKEGLKVDINAAELLVEQSGEIYLSLCLGSAVAVMLSSRWHRHMSVVLIAAACLCSAPVCKFHLS